jgi:hypothetical protein
VKHTGINSKEQIAHADHGEGHGQGDAMTGQNTPSVAADINLECIRTDDDRYDLPVPFEEFV